MLCRRAVLRFTIAQTRPFDHNSFVRNFWRVCSQFWLSARNLFEEGLLIEIQEEIHHFVVWGGGGSGAPKL